MSIESEYPSNEVLLESKMNQLKELEAWAAQGQATSEDREMMASLREEINKLRAELGGEQTVDKPKFEIGSEVFVQRSSGEVESGWTVSSYAEGPRRYIVTKSEGKGLMKAVPAAELEALQEKQKSKGTS